MSRQGTNFPFDDKGAVNTPGQVGSETPSPEAAAQSGKPAHPDRSNLKQPTGGGTPGGSNTPGGALNTRPDAGGRGTGSNQ